MKLHEWITLGVSAFYALAVVMVAIRSSNSEPEIVRLRNGKRL